MQSRQVLFLSWQGGMGHVTRDIAIARELRHQNPNIDIVWLAHPLASKVLQEAGEKILPESESSADYNQAGVPALTTFRLDLMRYDKAIRKPSAHNVNLFKEVVSNHTFGLIIGDESYEVVEELNKGMIDLDCPMVMIEDFFGFEAMTKNPIEWIGIYQLNRYVAKTVPRSSEHRLTRMMVGELEDVRDKSLGFLLPNRRCLVKKYYHILGYVIRFDPDDYADKSRIRAKLGYGEEPLIICATGGTAAGKELLETCGKAYNIIKNGIPNVRMICVCGELYGLTPPELPEGIELRSYVSDIYEHYAACDIAVVVGGGTTTVELTALRRPFIYFPLENQFDQQLYITERLERHGAGIKMRYFQTTPDQLARTITEHIGRDVNWNQIPTDGAQKAARLINNLLPEG